MKVSRLADDRAAQACSDDELRALLRSDDAPTRLRAAWALGERLGASAIPDLRESQAREQSVGVRRHLLVVLAGMQEIAPILAITRDDPDPRLRATASACLARRVPDDHACVAAIVDRLAHERDASVLLAIVQSLPAIAPPLLEAGCDTLLKHTDTELRHALVERRIAQGGALLALELLERMTKDGADVRARVLDAWIASAGPSEVVRAVAAAPVAIVADAIARVARGTVAWSDLGPIAARNLAALDALLLPHATDSLDLGCRSFLVAVIARAIDPASRVHADTARFRSDLVRDAVLRLEPALLARPVGSDPALSVLLEITERTLAGADPGRLADDEHWLASIVGELRCRLGAPGPHGWMGALWHVRDPQPRTLIDHTAPDGTSMIVLAASAGIELRAPLHKLRAIASAVEDASIGVAIEALWRGPLELEPDPLDRALSRSFPPYAALAIDLQQVARIAAARGAKVRAELIEGWWDHEHSREARHTMLDPKR